MRRPEEQRVREGIPELRFGARGKGAALGIPSLGRGISGRVRNAGDLPYLVAAIEIQGLRQVGLQMGSACSRCMMPQTPPYPPPKNQTTAQQCSAQPLTAGLHRHQLCKGPSFPCGVLMCLQLRNTSR